MAQLEGCFLAWAISSFSLAVIIDHTVLSFITGGDLALCNMMIHSMTFRTMLIYKSVLFFYCCQCVLCLDIVQTATRLNSCFNCLMCKELFRHDTVWTAVLTGKLRTVYSLLFCVPQQVFVIKNLLKAGVLRLFWSQVGFWQLYKLWQQWVCYWSIQYKGVHIIVG